MKGSITWFWCRAKTQIKLATIALLAVTLSGCFIFENNDGKDFLATQSGSGIVYFTQGNTNFVAAILDTGTLRIFSPDANGDLGAARDTETAVGGPADEERSGIVLASPDGTVLYAIRGGSVSVFSVAANGALTLTRSITANLGPELRGADLAPNGTKLYVASLTAKEVYAINTSTFTVENIIPVNGNPLAIMVTNDGDDSDTDERVYVTVYFGRVIDGEIEGTNQQRNGVVVSFLVTSPEEVTEMVFAPADMGINLGDSAIVDNTGATFATKLSNFCNTSAANADIATENQIFCGDNAGSTTTVAGDFAGISEFGFFNQLFYLVGFEETGYVGSIFASPAPPVHFAGNVNGGVGGFELGDTDVRSNLTFNFNTLAEEESAPADPTTSLGKLFMTDNHHGGYCGDYFYGVNRSGDFVFRLPVDGDGELDTGNVTDVARFQVKHGPVGITFNADCSRAYVLNELNKSVTTLNINVTDAALIANKDAGTRQARVEVEALPTSGAAGLNDQEAFDILLGKFLFWTGLGADRDIRDQANVTLDDIDSVANRDMASKNNWSSCASCHSPWGLADGVTWIFATGPRQTIPMDGTFEEIEGDAPAALIAAGASNGCPVFPQSNRLFECHTTNWSSVRGGTTDFNNNSRNVQFGDGFLRAGEQNRIFNHGPQQTPSDVASDVGDFSDNLIVAWQIWSAAGIRTLDQPAGDPGLVAQGRAVFGQNCVGCHGGFAWSNSSILFADDSLMNNNPLAGGTPRPATVVAAGAQVTNHNPVGVGTTNAILNDVGTFDLTGGAADGNNEVRGIGGGIGLAALGAAGLRSVSLLGVGYTAPYLHGGIAVTIDDVFDLHEIGGQPISDALTAQEQEQLKAFLDQLDSNTEPFLVSPDPISNVTIPNIEIREAGCPQNPGGGVTC